MLYAHVYSKFLTFICFIFSLFFDLYLFFSFWAVSLSRCSFFNFTPIVVYLFGAWLLNSKYLRILYLLSLKYLKVEACTKTVIFTYEFYLKVTCLLLPTIVPFSVVQWKRVFMWSKVWIMSLCLPIYWVHPIYFLASTHHSPS